MSVFTFLLFPLAAVNHFHDKENFRLSVFAHIPVWGDVCRGS